MLDHSIRLRLRCRRCRLRYDLSSASHQLNGTHTLLPLSRGGRQNPFIICIKMRGAAVVTVLTIQSRSDTIDPRFPLPEINLFEPTMW